MRVSKMFTFNRYTQKLERADHILPTWEARIYIKTAIRLAQGRLDKERASEYRERLWKRYRAILGV